MLSWKQAIIMPSLNIVPPPRSTITDKIIGTFTKLHHLDKNRDSYKHLPSPTPLNNVAKQCWTICQHCQGWSKEGELCVDRSLEI